MTFQACNIDEARVLYDQLAVLAPIMVCSIFDFIRSCEPLTNSLNTVKYYDSQSSVNLMSFLRKLIQKIAFEFAFLEMAGFSLSNF